MARKIKGGSPDAGTPDALAPGSTMKAVKAAKGKTPRKAAKKNQSVKQAQAEIERAEKRKEALELRRMGYTYAQIGEELNIATTTASNYVRDAIAEIPQEAAEDVRRLELDRLDYLQQEVWLDYTESKQPGLLDAILKIMDKRAKYLRLDVTDEGENFMNNLASKMVEMANADRPVLRPDGPVPANPIL